MTFRIAHLNMEKDCHRWDIRRHMIVDQLAAVAPDIFGMNEISIPRQTARWMQAQASERIGHRYALVQQTKPNGGTKIEAEGVLTRFPILETSNLDYQAYGYVALVARMEIEERLVDVYVTHLYRSAGEESLRVFQVSQLLEWIDSRDDVDAQIVCGDFNAMPDAPAAKRMAETFRPSQTEPTAFTLLSDETQGMAHPDWKRMDHCFDYIWVRGPLEVGESKVCFNEPDPDDDTLWPSDHAGVWADISWV